jgi:hypothetical protein
VILRLSLSVGFALEKVNLKPAAAAYHSKSNTFSAFASSFILILARCARHAHKNHEEAKGKRKSVNLNMENQDPRTRTYEYIQGRAPGFLILQISSSVRERQEKWSFSFTNSKQVIKKQYKFHSLTVGEGTPKKVSTIVAMR